VDVAVLVRVEVVDAVTVLVTVDVETVGEVTSELHAELRSVDEKVLRGVGVVFEVAEAAVVARRCNCVVGVSVLMPLLRRRMVEEASNPELVVLSS
jgi:hypothetical protein